MEPYVFDRFYRVAEAHGGTVAAEPAAGGGTTFTLRLPTLPDPRRAASVWAERPPSRTSYAAFTSG